MKAGRELKGHTLFMGQRLQQLAGADSCGQAGNPARSSVYFYKRQVCLSAVVMKLPPTESF